jgi:hypothetical protein
MTSKHGLFFNRELRQAVATFCSEVELLQQEASWLRGWTHVEGTLGGPALDTFAAILKNLPVPLERVQKAHKDLLMQLA